MDAVRGTDFEGTRLRRPGTYAVCATATWCPFCRKFAPLFQAKDGHVAGTLATLDLSDESNPLWETLSVEVVPTILGYRDGTLAWRIDGRSMRGLAAKDLEKMAGLMTAGSNGGPRA